VIEPHVHVAYAPQGAGLQCALFWFVREDNVYGWFTGARAYEHPARYFMLEDYYRRRETQCYFSVEDDVYGAWKRVTTETQAPIDRPLPVAPELCVELDRLQDAFVLEWLFYEGAQGSAEEASLLALRGLPVLAVNIRASRINKLARDGPVWTYCTPGADLRIVGYLSRRWDLDYAPD
jgi:hypothetical protein